MWVLLITVGWVVCGILAYGIEMGYLWGEFNLLSELWRSFIVLSIFMGVCGPIGLIVSLSLSGFGRHGLKFW